MVSRHVVSRHAGMLLRWDADVGHASRLTGCHAGMIKLGTAVALACWQAPWHIEKAHSFKPTVPVKDTLVAELAVLHHLYPLLRHF